MEFGPNCELLRTKLAPTKKAPPPLPPPPQKGPMPTDAGNQNRWEPLQLGAYSGKPGYYVRIGTEFQSKLDALIMNEEVLAKVEKATAELKLGGLTTCQGMGLQQAIGYTLFDLRHCEN